MDFVNLFSKVLKRSTPDPVFHANILKREPVRRETHLAGALQDPSLGDAQKPT